VGVRNILKVSKIKILTKLDQVSGYVLKQPNPGVETRVVVAPMSASNSLMKWEKKIKT